MRKIIAIEGRDTIIKQYLEPDSLTWPDEDLPVVWNFNFEKFPVGKAKDIRREGDGTITAEIYDLTPDAHDLIESKNASMTIFARELVTESDKEKLMIVKSAKIKAISMVPSYCVEW